MEIKTFAPSSHKIKAVIYGKSGAGKTYFSATAPKPIFASAEGGLLATLKHKKAIDPIKYVEIRKVEDLRDLLNFLKDSTKHDYQTVVIDSITEINEIIKEGIEKKRGAQMQLKDWGDLGKAIKNILRGFRDLDMHVLFIAQQKEERDGDVITAVVPSLNGKAANEIAYFMDIVAYCYVDKTGQNHITTQPNEKLLTKSRGIEFEGDAPDDFEDWISAMSAIEIKKEEVETVDMNPKKPEAQPEPPKYKGITSETSKALFSAWEKFYKTIDKPANRKMDFLKASLKKEFNGKESTRELTEDEALSFVERLNNMVANFKDAQKKEKGTMKQVEGAAAEVLDFNKAEITKDEDGRFIASIEFRGETWRGAGATKDEAINNLIGHEGLAEKMGLISTPEDAKIE